MKILKKILIALGATAIIGGGLFAVNLGGTTYTEVPLVETKIGDEYRAFYKSTTNPNDIISQELTKGQYDSLATGTSESLQIKGYKFISAYGGKPIIATSAPILKDNEFYKLSTSSDQIMLKLPGKKPALKSTADVQKTSIRLVEEANAAIAIDTYSAQSSACEGVTSCTVSYTVGAVSNPALIIFFVLVNSGDRVTGVTYGGDAMTRLSYANNIDNRGQYNYGIVNCKTGTNNIVISLSGSYNIRYTQGISFSGVATTGLPDAAVISTKTNCNPCTQTLTTVADNAVAIEWNYGNRAALSAGTNATEVYDGGNAISLNVSNPLAITPAGSFSLSINSDGNMNVTMSMVTIAPSAEAPVPTAVPNNDIIIFE